MGQAFTEDWYELAYNANSAFVNAEQNDNTLRSNFSGNLNPANPVPGQQWYDLDTTAMKLYTASWNQALLHGTVDFKIWLYTNNQQPAFYIDNSVTDVVLALRGGASSYNTTGGTVAGTWDSTSGATVNADGAHQHLWKQYNGFDQTFDGVGGYLTPVRALRGDGIIIGVSDGDGWTDSRNFHTNILGDHTHTLTNNSNWRPQAAVGTMQYPNLD